MTIQEQIDWLTGYAEALHHRDGVPHESITQVRDTFTEMNRVVEAAQNVYLYCVVDPAACTVSRTRMKNLQDSLTDLRANHE